MSIKGRLDRLEHYRRHGLTHAVPCPAEATEGDRAKLLATYLSQHPEAEGATIIMPERIRKVCQAA